jgi:hypothetical protein
MLLSSAVFLGCGLAGAYLGGATGTVRGAALATWVGALLWWWQLDAGMRESDKVPARTRYLFRGRRAGRHGVATPSPMPAATESYGVGRRGVPARGAAAGRPQR